MDQIPKVLVVGCTRGVGLEATKLLLKNTHKYQIRALVRSRERASDIFGVEASKIEFIEGDVTKQETLQPACNGVNTIVCTIGATSGWRFPGQNQTTPKNVDFLGVKNLSETAALAEVSKFVLVSSLGVTRTWFPVTILLNTLMGRVMVWKLKGENALRDVCKTNGQMTYHIVRPGGLNNENGGKHGIVIDQGDKGSGMISRADVAQAILECVDGDCTPNSTFEIWSTKAEGKPDFSKLSQLVPDK